MCFDIALLRRRDAGFQRKRKSQLGVVCVRVLVLVRMLLLAWGFFRCVSSGLEFGRVAQSGLSTQ